MRKQHGGDKAKKFMVYLIGFIMVFSVFGVIFWGDDTTSNVRYNGFKFTNKGNYWSTTVGGKEAIFAYTPSSVEFIDVEDYITNKLKNAIEIDVTSDFNDTFAEEIALAQFQMVGTLNNFNVFVRSGFTSENPSNFNVITCDDATDFVPVIYFKKSNDTSVYLENNCIIAEAASENDVLGIKDRLVYGMMGVIE